MFTRITWITLDQFLKVYACRDQVSKNQATNKARVRLIFFNDSFHYVIYDADRTKLKH